MKQNYEALISFYSILIQAKISLIIHGNSALLCIKLRWSFYAILVKDKYVGNHAEEMQESLAV